MNIKTFIPLICTGLWGFSSHAVSYHHSESKHIKALQNPLVCDLIPYIPKFHAKNDHYIALT